MGHIESHEKGTQEEQVQYIKETLFFKTVGGDNNNERLEYKHENITYPLAQVPKRFRQHYIYKMLELKYICRSIVASDDIIHHNFLEESMWVKSYPAECKKMMDSISSPIVITGVNGKEGYIALYEKSIKDEEIIDIYCKVNSKDGYLNCTCSDFKRKRRPKGTKSAKLRHFCSHVFFVSRRVVKGQKEEDIWSLQCTDLRPHLKADYFEHWLREIKNDSVCSLVWCKLCGLEVSAVYIKEASNQCPHCQKDIKGNFFISYYRVMEDGKVELEETHQFNQFDNQNDQLNIKDAQIHDQSQNQAMDTIENDHEDLYRDLATFHDVQEGLATEEEAKQTLASCHRLAVRLSLNKDAFQYIIQYTYEGDIIKPTLSYISDHMDEFVHLADDYEHFEKIVLVNTVQSYLWENSEDARESMKACLTQGCMSFNDSSIPVYNGNNIIGMNGRILDDCLRAIKLRCQLELDGQFLFHGTSYWGAKAIFENGIDLDECHARAGWGRGFYTTQDPVFAKWYARRTRETGSSMPLALMIYSTVTEYPEENGLIMRDFNDSGYQNALTNQKQRTATKEHNSLIKSFRNADMFHGTASWRNQWSHIQRVYRRERSVNALSSRLVAIMFFGLDDDELSDYLPYYGR